MTNYSVDFVIKLALILLLSTLPSLAYLLIFRKAKERWQMRLRRARILTVNPPRSRQGSYHDYDYGDSYILSDDYIPGTNFVGDTSCINNAQSPHLRCAINPSGPCDGCSHYEKRCPSK